jgi:type I protein arginine methyltransferase
MTYNDIDVHLFMLQDRIRTEGYERAIKAVVRPGDRVLDFGCGTGILSFFAARAGASTVYAIDRSPMIRTAQEIARANGFTNVRFFKGEGSAVELPSKVDVIVSEFMGHFVFFEQMLPPFLGLRDRWLADGGAIIPARVGLHAALVGDKSGAEDRAFFRARPYGVDYSIVADWPFFESTTGHLGPDQLLFDPIPLADLDLRSIGAPPEALCGEMTPPRDATVYALCGWFDTLLADGVGFGTGPSDPPTHWSQMVFPLVRPFRARAGRPIRITISPARQGKDDSTVWRWTIADDADGIDMDDFVIRSWAARPLADGWLP